MDLSENKKLNLKVLSLFSGGGFLDLGFINQGFKINQAVEINPYFINSYNHGLKACLNNKAQNLVDNVLFSEITAPVDASSKVSQEGIKTANKEVSGIIGGPPCQDYSVGGTNAGMTGEKGKLIYSYYEIVKNIKPTFIFFENVPGLYNTKIHQVAFLDLICKLESLGYAVWFDILNSLQYGIPQDRPRLTLVGFRKEIVEGLEKAGYKGKGAGFDDSEELVFRWPKKLFSNPKLIKWPKRWQFGSKILEEDINQIPDDHKNLQVINAFAGIESDTPNQDEYFKAKSSKFLTVEEGDTNRKSFKRLHRFRYSPTVAYGNNEVHLHPTLARRLTVREALRLQSVPDSYILPDGVPLTHKFKLISNGVPVKKATLIAAEIKRTLYNYYTL